MSQETTRLQKLGRQKSPAWLALKVPPKLPKLAECNAPVGAVRSHVECHIADQGTELDAAQQAVQEYMQAEARRQHKLHKLEQSREAMKARIHKHIQGCAGTAQAADLKLQERQAKQERLQKFNEHVQELRFSLKQMPAAKMLARQEEEEQVVPSTSEAAFAAQQNNRTPLVTRHVSNRQMPADCQAAFSPAGLQSQLSQAWGVGSCASIGATCSSAAPPEVMKARVTDAKQTALEKKLKEKRLSLPALCGCPHGLSPLSTQYPFACAINCPLYQNTELYTKMLQHMLQSYNL